MPSKNEICACLSYLIWIRKRTMWYNSSLPGIITVWSQSNWMGSHCIFLNNIYAEELWPAALLNRKGAQIYLMNCTLEITCWDTFLATSFILIWQRQPNSLLLTQHETACTWDSNYGTKLCTCKNRVIRVSANPPNVFYLRFLKFYLCIQHAICVWSKYLWSMECCLIVEWAGFEKREGTSLVVVGMEICSILVSQTGVLTEISWNQGKIADVKMHRVEYLNITLREEATFSRKTHKRRRWGAIVFMIIIMCCSQCSLWTMNQLWNVCCGLYIPMCFTFWLQLTDLLNLHSYY